MRRPAAIRAFRRAIGGSLALTLVLIGCGREPALEAAETFSWCAQPIAFSPPPPPWRREAENSGGMLGVRFVLTGGLGEVVSAVAFPSLSTSERPAELAEVLPRLRLRPERMQEPDRWRIGYERDTTIAGHPAFAGDDTLVTPERPMLYQEVFWVVNGCAFKATYQGTPKNLGVFRRLVDSIRFPEAAPDPAR